MIEKIALAVCDELQKLGYYGFHPAQQLTAGAAAPGAAVPVTPAAPPAAAKAPANPIGSAIRDRLGRAGRFGRNAFIVGGGLALGSYALGRGLQSGVKERQDKEREEARRSAILSGHVL